MGWDQQNRVDITKPSIPQVPLFADKNLKLRNIAGYKTSIADGLSSTGHDFSDFDTESFDRLSAYRAILSLVLLSLTRAHDIFRWEKELVSSDFFTVYFYCQKPVGF